MNRLPFAALALFTSVVPSFAAVNLSGKLIQPDSLPKQGVVVSLSGTTLSDTTDAAGAWSLVGGSSSLGHRAAANLPVSSHLVLRNGRIQLSLAGRDAYGRSIQGTASSAPIAPFTWAGRSSAANGFDTLVYSWNGKTILRDTIASGSLERTGIVRYFDTTVNPAIAHGYVTDGQNHLYRTVAIGQQVWMAENLRLKVDSSWCYRDSAALCHEFGRLYQWTALFGISPKYNDSTRGKGDTLLQGICPHGWRIPTDSDFVVLLKGIDSLRSGVILRSTHGWRSTAEGEEIHDGTDTFGFHTPAAGYRNSNSQFDNLHTHAAFWTSSETKTPNQYRNNTIGSFAWTGHFFGKETFMVRMDNFKDLGMSARCIKGAGAPN